MGKGKTKDKLKGETTGSQQKFQENEVKLTVIAKKIQGKPIKQEQNVIKWDHQKNNNNKKKIEKHVLLKKSKVKESSYSFFLVKQHPKAEIKKVKQINNLQVSTVMEEKYQNERAK